MKRILVPTDFSKHAEYALRVAAQIAKKNNCEIILLHMLELPHQAGDALGSGHKIPEIIEKRINVETIIPLKNIIFFTIFHFDSIFSLIIIENAITFFEKLLSIVL